MSLFLCLGQQSKMQITTNNKNTYHKTYYKTGKLKSQGWKVKDSKEEWEFACAADTKTNFHHVETLSWKDANFNSTYLTLFAKNDPSTKKPTPVASYEPNLFGIYDMHGNAYEWTSSNYLTSETNIKNKDLFVIKDGS